MEVAEVARRAGVGAHAVRFYVRAGLLRADRDPSNNYKQFGESHLVRLRFIKGRPVVGLLAGGDPRAAGKDGLGRMHVPGDAPGACRQDPRGAPANRGVAGAACFHAACV